MEICEPRRIQLLKHRFCLLIKEINRLHLWGRWAVFNRVGNIWKGTRLPYTCLTPQRQLISLLNSNLKDLREEFFQVSLGLGDHL